jgi:hypothetical protein
MSSLRLFVALILLSFVASAGCGGSSTPTKSPTKAEPTKADKKEELKEPLGPGGKEMK